MEEDKKVIAHYFGYSNYKTFAEDEQIKKSMGTLSKSIVNIINELERLQKEFEAVDHECSRLEQKEIILENALNSEKTVHISKLKYLIDSNLEKTENGNYILASNDCQTIVRHLKRIVNNEDYDVTCLHCGKDTPLYCENCYQELITKNGELQSQVNMFDKAYTGAIQESKKWFDIAYDSIPKQVIRDKIQLLEKELKLLDINDKHTLIEHDYIISVLKELLGDE